MQNGSGRAGRFEISPTRPMRYGSGAIPSLTVSGPRRKAGYSSPRRRSQTARKRISARLIEADHDRRRRLGIFRFFIIDGAARGLSFVKCHDGAALLCRLPMRRPLVSVVKKSRQNRKSGAGMKYLVSFSSDLVLKFQTRIGILPSSLRSNLTSDQNSLFDFAAKILNSNCNSFIKICR